MDSPDPTRRAYRSEVARMRRVAADALASYEVDPARMTLLEHLENTTFRVDDTDGARYVLRVHRAHGDPFHPPRTVDEVESEMAWLTVLADQFGDAVPAPVPTAGGSASTVVASEGRRPRVCVLMRWVPGRFLDAGLGPVHLFRVGGLMGRLHAWSGGWAPPPGFTRPHLDVLSEEAVAHAVDVVGRLRGSEDAAVVAAVLDRVGDAGVAIGEGPDDFGLIHGDIHQENYLFRGDRVRLIDFDDCGWGHFLSDLAVTLSELDHLPRRAELSAALLDGYRGVRPLPDRIDDLLPVFVALRRLKIVLWIVENRHHPGFSDWEVDVADGLSELAASVG